MGEKVCLICDRFCLINSIKSYTVNQLPIDKMKQRLTPSSDLPLSLIKQYDVS